MGYTHYCYRKNQPISDDVWNAMCADVRRILAHHAAIVCRECDEPNKAPEVSAEKICFNGKGGDGHETFWFTRDYEPCAWREGDQFFFCKTAYKPYDEAVVDVLSCAKHHLPDLLEISSDGGDEVFLPFEQLAAKYGLKKSNPKPTS